MGFLGDGKALDWEAAEGEVAEYVRQHGVDQFVHVYNSLKDRITPAPLWGDEVEFLIVAVEGNETHLSLRGPEVLDALNAEAEHLDKTSPEGSPLGWRPEYGAFMIEAVPGKPHTIGDISSVQRNMRMRREAIQEKLLPTERVVAVTNFPRLGAQMGLWSDNKPHFFTVPHATPGGAVSQSLYTPDAIINPHERFRKLTANIRKRRGEKVCMTIPLFMDERTNVDLNSAHQNPEENCTEKNVIHMDSMAFGMGCCCLQVTFQCTDVTQARYLTDQLATLSPVFLALSAACPILKGLLSRWDVRWPVISGAVDDRTRSERGMPPLSTAKATKDTNDGGCSCVIPKSRYDSVSCYISDSPRLNDALHNDIPLEPCLFAKEKILEAGIDERMANHVSHLFIRDPLVVYSDRIKIDDATETDHWENIQSTNWQSVRFKPPPAHSDLGWRVEFRVLELQMTDFENAAFSVILSLIVAAIKHYDLNLYVPLSQVDEDFRASFPLGAASDRSWVVRAQFLPPSDPGYCVWYKKQPQPQKPGDNNNGDGDNGDQTKAGPQTQKEGRKESLAGVEPDVDMGDATTRMTTDELFNGQATGRFRGLVAGLRTFADSELDLAPAERAQLHNYLDFLGARASGELLTTAAWIRNFVTSHAGYAKDSVVTPEISHDLLTAAIAIGNGSRVEKTLVGEFATTAL